MIEISFGKLVLLALRRMRSGWDNVRAEVERELQIEEIKRTAREAAAHAEAAQAELDVAVQKVRDVGSELKPNQAIAVDVPGPAALQALPDVADPAPEAAADADSHTGDLFASLKVPGEASNGHA